MVTVLSPLATCSQRFGRQIDLERENGYFGRNCEFLLVWSAKRTWKLNIYHGKKQYRKKCMFFIKLSITAEPGPHILFFPCHLWRSSSMIGTNDFDSLTLITLSRGRVVQSDISGGSFHHGVGETSFSHTFTPLRELLKKDNRTYNFLVEKYTWMNVGETRTTTT